MPSFHRLAGRPAALLLLIVVSCGDAAVAPTPSPSGSTPVITSEPWTGRADVDDGAVRDAFLAALTVEERACAEEAFDQAGLLRLTEQALDQAANRRSAGPDEGPRLARCLGKDEEESLMPEFLRAVAEVLPEVTAPHRLGDKNWPAERSAIRGLMERAATELGGAFQDEGGEAFRVTLGEEDSRALQARDWSMFAPGEAAEAMMAIFALGADWDVLAAARDGDLVWVRWETTGNGERFEVLQWGEPGSAWTFAASGAESDQVDVAAAGFGRAAGGG